MKTRLQTSLGQQLVLTPQLRQAIHLLQLSGAELEAELAEAVESNPLLDWEEPAPLVAPAAESAADASTERSDAGDATGDWEREEAWTPGGAPPDDEGGDASERVVEPETLRDHLLWQLHLSPLPVRDRRIGIALVDAIDEDGYLREPLAAIRESLRPELEVGDGEIATVLHQLQRFDPVGVGARNLAECLSLQLQALPADAPGRPLAQRIVDALLERVPKIGIDGVATELGCSREDADTALQLLRSLDPRPGARLGSLPNDTYVTPDCVVYRQHGVWRVALAGGHTPRLTIHRGYEQMIARACSADAGYLRGRLQEARWLLKNLEARGETLLKVMRCLVKQQAGFLEFGEQALRPLTLREVAAEVGLHESTVSRAVSRKYVRTPRGTLSLRAFFASGIETGGGGETSSTAIQSMIRALIDAENPRKPLSDARLAALLKAGGVPVARRTVAKYREAMSIPSSHDRIRIG
ncbi:MAG: RNA polymerase factor sigma-54 [Lysobacter sp.]|nr:RNA polymerase factor sigma-54 [Lysobacter sp.]